MGQRRIEIGLIEVGKGQPEIGANPRRWIICRFRFGQQQLDLGAAALGVVAHQVQRVVATLAPVLVTLAIHDCTHGDIFVVVGLTVTISDRRRA